MPSLDVYVVRHEEAGEAEEDEIRALTGRGRTRMRATAEKVALEAPRIDLIYTSPLVRAVQTAEILAAGLGLAEPIVVRVEIASPPSVGYLLRMIDEVPASVQGLALVGHEPTLSAMLKKMAGWSQSVDKGQVIAVTTDRNGGYRLRWTIAPGGGRIDTLPPTR